VIEILKLREDAPDELKSRLKNILPGSVIVKSPHDSRIYFEGGKYDHTIGSEAEKRTEWAKQAAGRAQTRYPTVAFMGVNEADFEWFEEIGFVEIPGYNARWFRNEPSIGGDDD
jgi:hypothetical protein